MTRRNFLKLSGITASALLIPLSFEKSVDEFAKGAFTTTFSGLDNYERGRFYQKYDSYGEYTVIGDVVQFNCKINLKDVKSSDVFTLPYPSIGNVRPDVIWKTDKEMRIAGSYKMKV